MLNSSTKLLTLEDQNENAKQLENEIGQILKNDNILNLPYIEEICPACAKKKLLEETHCYRCKLVLSINTFIPIYSISVLQKKILKDICSI